jgi:TIR domain-containing protein
MSAMFISYSRFAGDFVLRLTATLQDNYGDVWIDQQSLMPASSWRQEIVEAITAANNFIAILPPWRSLTPLSQPEFESGQILSVVESPDRSYLLIAISEGPPTTGANPVVVRSLNLDSLQHQACAIAHRNLTRQEWNDLIGSEYHYEKLCPQYP